MKKLFALSLALLLSACAYAVEGSIHEMHIETPGGAHSVCYLEYAGRRYAVRPPETVHIAKSTEPMDIKCLAPGNRSKMVTVYPKTNDAAMLNVANGLVPGLYFDYRTGAMYEYPSIVSIDFSDTPVRSMPLPVRYATKPDGHGAYLPEEFRPEIPRLSNDVGAPMPHIRKRGDMGSEYDAGAEIVEQAFSETMTPDELTELYNPRIVAPQDIEPKAGRQNNGDQYGEAYAGSQPLYIEP